MRIWPLLIIASASTALLVAGCATPDTRLEQQTLSIRRGAFLLSATNAEPRQAYDLGVYVISKGDTVAKITREFQLSIRDLMAMNPDLDPTRLVTGQKVRIYERRKE